LPIFTTLLPGPLATLLLAEAGARWSRSSAPAARTCGTSAVLGGAIGGLRLSQPRQKKSLVADLKQDADRSRVLELVDRADVLVEQFRPGVMKRLGLGYDAVRARNPKIIYCSITGYGQEGRAVTKRATTSTISARRDCSRSRRDRWTGRRCRRR